MVLPFEMWKREVDRAIGYLIGLSADDLPDMPYRRWYDARTLPVAAAKRAIRLAKTY